MPGQCGEPVENVSVTCKTSMHDGSALCDHEWHESRCHYVHHNSVPDCDVYCELASVMIAVFRFCDSKLRTISVELFYVFVEYCMGVAHYRHIALSLMPLPHLLLVNCVSV